MKLNNSFTSTFYQDISTNFSQKLDKSTKLSAKNISDSYLAQYQIKISQNMQFEINKQIDTFTLKDIGYDGKSIGNLTQDEAKNLVNEDSFFGIKKTSDRLSSFVLNGAGDNIDMLKAGRDAMLKGFEEAKKLWGGELPKISQETMKKTIEIIDTKLRDLGASSINTTA
ncbi:MAG: hydrogenase [Epsilonproteobacteria bacterium]|nr:hydrogenase [Campylobacterota bacterium]